MNTKGYQIPDGWLDTAGSGDIILGDLGPTKAAVLVLLQPDDKLDFGGKGQLPSSRHTFVQMFKRTEDLVDVLKSKTADELEKIMGWSNKLAKSHVDRFQTFGKLPPRQACLLFGGQGLRAATFSESEEKFAESHLRMISGLYGVLRPYDDVKPVRDVPMGAELDVKRGDEISETIQEFWGDNITKQVGKDALAAAKNHGGKAYLIGCLSKEYWKAIQVSMLPKDVTPIFVDFEGANEENTRKGRSALARYIVRKACCNLLEVKDFDDDDWKMVSVKSGGNSIVWEWVGEVSGAAKEKKIKKKDEKDKKARDRSPGGSSGGSQGGRDVIKPGVVAGSDSEAEAAAPSKRKQSRVANNIKPGVVAGSDSDAEAAATTKRKQSRAADGIKPGVVPGSDSQEETTNRKQPKAAKRQRSD